MDLQDDDNMDDIGFDLDDEQATIHRVNETKKEMEKVADAIWDSLRECASTMSTIPEPRRGRRR